MADYEYEGNELDLFAAATNWKGYLRRQVSPYLGRNVLEVGAGLGGTTRVFCDPSRHQSWLGLEPDSGLAARANAAIARGELPACCRVVVGTLESLDPALDQFDALIYIDVLEHIADDRAELGRAARRLKAGGYLVVLSPAHQWLFTPFDQAIGHHRRYSSRTLRETAADLACLELVRLRYLDSVGFFASLANRLVLKASMPSARQIAVWDRLMVPCSRGLDPLLGHSFGKSILGVWQRRA